MFVLVLYSFQSCRPGQPERLPDRTENCDIIIGPAGFDCNYTSGIPSALTLTNERALRQPASQTYTHTHTHTHTHAMRYQSSKLLSEGQTYTFVYKETCNHSDERDRFHGKLIFLQGFQWSGHCHSFSNHFLNKNVHASLQSFLE